MATYQLPLPPSNLVPVFGSYRDNSVYPKDKIYLTVRNAIDIVIAQSYDITNYTLIANNLTLNLSQDIIDLGYITGKYLSTYTFFRQLLGSPTAEKLIIHEISSDRLEARVVPIQSTIQDPAIFNSWFEQGFFDSAKSVLLPNLYMVTLKGDKIPVLDYVRDDITFPDFPYSIIFKFLIPLDYGIVPLENCWIEQEVSEQIVVSDILLTVEPEPIPYNLLRSPDFDIEVNTPKRITEYKNWDQILETSSSQLINKIFSGSKVEGVDLNTDYRSFQNYVFFGSAKTRLSNFKYKLEQIETYSNQINTLNAYNTSSTEVINNIIQYEQLTENILGNFDAYERYLYYQSASYESSSLGEFYPVTWPKVNSEEPYILYATTSSQAMNWYDRMIYSASIYDKQNSNSLYKLIPLFIRDNEYNSNYVNFVNMIGHYYDILLLYIREMANIYDRHEDPLIGISKDILLETAGSLGIDLNTEGSKDGLVYYLLDKNINYLDLYKSTKDLSVEVTKRLMATLPYIRKTKGTERSVRSIINCFGIPSTVLEIREFGGPQQSETGDRLTVSTQKENYALNIGTTNDYRVQVPWARVRGTSQCAQSIEIRYKTSDVSDFTVIESPNNWLIQTDYVNNKLKFVLQGSGGDKSASIDINTHDGSYWNVMLNVVDSTYTLYVAKSVYQKVPRIYSASLINPGTSYNTSYNNTGYLYLGGYSDAAIGSMQEFRLWKNPLSVDAFKEHTLAPNSIVYDPQQV